jgi:hypothetical protein
MLLERFLRGEHNRAPGGNGGYGRLTAEPDCEFAKAPAANKAGHV